jgi:hypothetical protein
LSEQEKLVALNACATRLGYKIDLSLDKRGYCLWQTLPGVGRYLVLGREGGVAIDTIAKKLDELEVEKKKA